VGQIVAFVNQKGGVGKTTSAVNLTAALHAKGKKVLLCDFDPQANATSGMGVDKRKMDHSSYDLVINDRPAADTIVKTRFGDLIPSSPALSGAGVELVANPHREYALQKALEPVRDRYDYIFIDCPPSLELLTLNALCAADSILIPVQCEYYALEGLSDLMSTLRMVKRRLNPRLEIFGVALTMFDGRTNFSTQVAQEVRRHFPGKVFASVVPRNIRLAEAPSHGLPVTVYDRSSRGAKAYKAMAEEIKKKLTLRGDKLGEQFPLSARFGPYIKATQEVVSSPTVTAMSVPRGNRTYYGAAKDEFKKCYAKNEAVNMAGTGIIVKLQGDIARESMTKVLNRGGEQVLLDIIPYAKELIEGGKILGIERLQHTTNKLSGLFAYRVYNIFDYATTDPKTKKSQQRHTRLLQPLFKSTIVTVSFTLSVA